MPTTIAGAHAGTFRDLKDPGQGTGLGLPLAVGIARGMGGRLAWANAAEDRPEAGAVFRLILPLAGADGQGGRGGMSMGMTLAWAGACAC